MASTVTVREFSIKDEFPYNRSGPMHWLLSHGLRYPIFPILMILAAAGNNYAFSYVQIFVGRAFDVVTSSGWTQADLLRSALLVFAAGFRYRISKIHLFGN